jgi:hypothetical protein
MILNNSYSSIVWYKKCNIEGDMIIAQYGDGIPWQAYNPFDTKDRQKPLYFDFIELDKDIDILNFISKYGFIYREWNDYSIADGIIIKSIKPFEIVQENVNDIKKEALLMRYIIDLKNALEEDANQKDRENRGFGRLNSLINSIYKLNGRAIEQDFPDKYPESNYMSISPRERMHTPNVARELICIEINHKLKNTHQVMYYAPLADEFKENINCPNLLTAMYVMIYQDFITGKKYRKCENETCEDWFLIDSNHDKKYCCERCARLQAQREYRKRIKSKKGRD